MTDRTSASWLVYTLGALCAGAIAAAILVVGPASGSQATATRTATVARGVVQSTVSGSGNLQPASELNLGFRTSGTVTNIYVTQGEQVAQGQLLATLNPQSAEVTLEQAKASLQSAEASLAKEQETNGEGSSGGTGGSATASTPTAAAASAPSATATADSKPSASSPAGAPAASTPSAATTPVSTTPASTPTSTTPSRRTTTTTPTNTSPSKSKGTSTGKGEATEAKSSAEAKSSSTVSAATREANLASARAAVRSDKLTVQSDEQAVQDTRLYAPEGGTIASLSGQVGENVSASGTTRASTAASASATSGSGASAAGGASGAGGRSSAAGSSASSSSSSSSSSAFAVLSDLSSMQLIVALSESEIGSVKAGQIATVTIEALASRKVAAHVGEVAILSTSNSGVISYNVTFQLDQMEAGLKPGMSATAEVVVKQAEGINVPTSAISGGSVTVLRSGKQVRQRVVTGLAGNNSTIILSGLKAGETIVLPASTTTSTTGTSLRGRLGGGLGGGGGGLAGAGAFFRGGG
jgi:multidrug efflux pump subunit AcrA (membrane-fusion protein)